MHQLPLKDRLIVALDFPSLNEALQLMDQLGDTVHFYKVGLELLTSTGAPVLISTLKKRGVKIFLDGKFNDIPNTIAAASRETSRLGVDLFNVHASIGHSAMEAAAKAKGGAALIAVTVLTSLDDNDCQSIFHQTAAHKVKEFAQAAKRAGLDGVVCSPQELALLAEAGGFSDFMKVTPGVRPAWSDVRPIVGSENHDQKRIMTPAEAIHHGATHLVIGRPITRPPASIGSAKNAALKILEEMDKSS